MKSKTKIIVVRGCTLRVPLNLAATIQQEERERLQLEWNANILD